jgi:hypothetical protein
MNDDGQQPRNGVSPNLTVAGDINLNPSTARPRKGSGVGAGQKICCHCGKDVAHEERFKDRAGHYWCMDCGVEENRAKHAIGTAVQPVPCADCSEPFPAEQLVERDRVKLCAACVEKRDKAAEREAHRQAARKAAAIQDAIDAERRQRRILIGAGIGAAVLVAWAVYALVF